MPHSASLLRGTHACFGSGKRPTRAGPHRLPPRPSAAAQDRASKGPTSSSGSSIEGGLVQVDPQADGTMVFRFGVEEARADAPAASDTHHAAPAAAASAAAAEVAATAAAAAAAATAAPAPAPEVVSTPAAARHAAPASGGGNGAAAPSAAALQLEDLLHRSLGSDDEEEGRRRNGSSNGASSSSSSVGNGWYQGPASTGPAAGLGPARTIKQRSSGQGATRQQQQQQQRGGQPRGQQHTYLGNGFGGSGGPGGAPQQRALAGAAPAGDARTLDYSEASVATIVATYDRLCEFAELDEALHLMKQCTRAGRVDVISTLRHYRFLRPAGTFKAVKQALRFVQLLPRQFADERTYNMLLRVCAQAGDLRNALHVADMLKAAGLKMDGILYTTLISTCAAAGDADKAFQLYAEMKATGVPADRMVYSSVVKACAERIERLPPSERRQQLVLLERAFNLVEDMKGSRVVADAAVWNALVTAAGRAGQLQRAFNVLEDMVGSNTRPNDRTYASLMDACARAGDCELALRVYRKAQREGCAGSLMVYSAAINACVHAREGCDAEAAMAIYQDMQRNRVEPDNQLYGMLMRAAGASGDMSLVLVLAEEMRREGLTPCTGTESALMAVHVQHSQLPEAQRIYRSLRAAGEWPHAYALNALINSYANSFRLGDVVSLVCDMAEGGQRPDSFTFSAIFNACQRAEEAELALDVARVMKLRGVRMDETHAVILLRICYNRLRQSWVPGGYPPNRASAPVAVANLPGSRRSHECQRLLEALTPRGRAVEVREGQETAWLAQAFGIYREAVASGVKPSMRMLNRVLMCLRVAYEGKVTPTGVPGAPDSLLPHQLPAQLGSFTAGAAAAAAGGKKVSRQEKIGVESVYHVQAISILEEAIISNVVPSFKLEAEEPVDLRGMPPAVAEVYVLTVLSAVQRLCEARRVISADIVLLVPHYDGSKVFMPSSISHVDYDQITEGGRGEAAPPAAAAAPGGGSRSGSFTDEDVDGEEEEEYGMSFAEADAAFARAAKGEPVLHEGGVALGGAPGDSPVDQRTGLGVAGVLRRLQVWAREHGEKGYILLEAKELTRWSKAMQRAVDKRSASALAVQKPYGQTLHPMAGLSQQQRQIRMGM